MTKTASQMYQSGRAHAPRRLGEGLPLGHWYAGGSARIEIDPSGREWVVRDQVDPGREVRPSVDLLGQFIQLAAAPSRAIASFVKRFGSLELCAAHSLPLVFGAGTIVANPVWDSRAWMVSKNDPALYHHNPYTPGVSADDYCMSDRFAAEDESAQCERVDVWRGYAGAADAFIRLGAAINDGESGDRSDWDILGVDFDTMLHQPNQTLEAILNYWVELAGLRLGISLIQERSEPGVTLAPILTTTTLFAGIVSEIVASIAAPGRCTFCSECGTLYAPERKPNPSRRRFCPDCTARGAPEAHASRAYRARNKVKATETARRPTGGTDG